MEQEFDSSWFYILKKIDESKCKPKQYRNFQIGNYYEKDALEHITLLELLLPCIFDFLSRLRCSGEGTELADYLLEILCW